MGYELNGVGVALLFIWAGYIVSAWMILEIIDLRSRLKKLEERDSGSHSKSRDV